MKKWILWLVVAIPVLVWGGLSLYPNIWWVENIIAFPALFLAYYVLASCLLLFLKSWAHLVVSVIAMSVYYMLTLPSTTLHRHQCDRPVSIVQFNLYYENQDPNAFINYLMAHPSDLVVMQEVAPEIGEKLKLLGDLYPYQYGGQEGVGYPSSQMILSRHPLEEMSVYTTPDRQHVISGSWKLSPGRQVHLLTAHPPSPRSLELWHRRNALISTVERMVESYSSDEMLIVGDFNLSATSIRYAKLFPGFDSAAVASWPNWNHMFTTPAFTMIGIDHLWIKSQKTGWRICSRSTRESVSGSDHKAVKTIIGY
ncbi:endonuclease/exonuclease/phosphatase family protein [Vibrio mexicanus]|uniref:endonuclease/exonuclease/phosphatase family protein n=1 Tax=Vibrio mexicanus TaxID=1004326 RepID=UPI00063C7D1C|nr:endonuclease/exonuclease/phosphatase family protein [Vibrio mexicanus]